MPMLDTEKFLLESQTEAKKLADEIHVKTGFSLDWDDPTVVGLLAQRRWLEDFIEQKIYQEQELKDDALFHLRTMLSDMKSLAE
ncbi:MAG: hypothetical protein IKZ88_07135 [Neisseriaceae bacterium]|nr:hypothetical protein [Neisseriaceae bacterium]